MQQVLASLPGLAGKIARYVDMQLEDSAPHISIPAALSFISLLKAGKYEGNESIAPNLYCCVVAGSGTGKSQAQRAIQDLVLGCDLQKLMMGKPASDSGLLKALQDQNRRFLIWDEFGIALSELSRSQASYRALILSTLMDLFSASGKVFLGKEYASQERIDIKEPYLALFAASTPNRFFGALNQDFVEDGFLSRWLLFFQPEKAGQRKDFNIDYDDLVAEIITLDEAHFPRRGNLADIFSSGKKLIHPPSNQRFIKEIFKERSCSAKSEIQRIFWSRAYEQYIKLCIVLTDSDETPYSVSATAADLVTSLIESAISACENSLYANERERTKEKFRAILKPGESVPISTVTRRAYRLNLSRTERKALIDDLVESGFWAKTQQAGTGQKRITTLTAL